MLRVRQLILCRDAARYWYDGEGSVGCDDACHTHERFEAHVHRDRVALPDATVITAVSFDDLAPYQRRKRPDFGLYLDPRWQPPWPHELVDWPDFGVPRDAQQLRAQLFSLLDRARAGQSVEVGCIGGHGRTGTALACLAIITGVPAGESVEWVHRNYCDAAVEDLRQMEFAASFTGDRR